jgi:hypothetical protein
MAGHHERQPPRQIGHRTIACNRRGRSSDVHADVHRCGRAAHSAYQRAVFQAAETRFVCEYTTNRRSRRNPTRITPPARASCTATGSVRDSRNIVAAIDDTLGQKESGDELEVVARRTHRRREHFPTDANLERLLSSKVVLDPSLESVTPLDDVGRLETLRRMAHRNVRSARRTPC